ncbi:MAG: DUF2666 family protein [Candidatus Micrarchaeia archaeon]
MSEQELSFFANVKGWQCIKRREIDESTENHEIVATLASIATSAGRKAFDFSGIDTARIQSYAAELTKGKRKSFVNAAEIFANLKPNDVKEKLSSMCGEEKLYPIAEAYLINCILTNLQLYPWIDLEILAGIYPELKIPKPRGRIAGSKKTQKS